MHTSSLTTRATCPASLTLLDLITRIIFGEGRLLLLLLLSSSSSSSSITPALMISFLYFSAPRMTTTDAGAMRLRFVAKAKRCVERASLQQEQKNE